MHLDGKPVRSCSTPLSAVGGKALTTIEGLSADGTHPVQQAWVEAKVPQCGDCQSGQIMAAVALLDAKPPPTDADDAPLTILGGIHRGFAPPRPADILNPVVGQGIVQVDAEVSWTSEIGARWRPHAALRFDVTAFRTDYDNQIVTGSLVGSAQRFVNAGRTLHQGIEIGTSVALDRLLAHGRSRTAVSADVAWTWLPSARFADNRARPVDPMQTVRGRRLPFAPTHVLNLGVGLSQTAGFVLRLASDVVSSQFADDLNTIAPSAQGRRGRLPGYVVFNASTRVPVSPLGRGTVLTASVKNLANRVYITDRQEGIMTGMPRLVTAGLEVAY